MPQFYETFERIAANELPRTVARFLTANRIPPPRNNKAGQWTERNVISLIRQEVYRGIEYRGKKETVRKYRSGKKVRRKNSPDAVNSRAMEHLRIVPDWLWFKANKALDDRVRNRDGASGDEHPLANIPRDSWGPLSNLFLWANSSMA